MARRKLEEAIDKVIDDLGEIDPSSADAARQLKKLHKKLGKIKDLAGEVEAKNRHLEKDATGHEARSADLAEDVEALEERYRFAIRMLELGYGISERDLDAVSGSTPEDAFRKLVRTARRVIDQGAVDAHANCAYAGACIAHQTGLAAAPCGAGGQPAHRGRYGAGASAPRAINPVLHASCKPGHCVPAPVGWILPGESCS